ncbi:MAG: PQQ-binding-like beta-propeller repeat protein [Gemmatimonadaceae bacterium]
MAKLQGGFVYVGIKTSVLALDRKTGEIRWSVKLPVKYPGSTVSGLANVWCDVDALFASCAGEIFCLDPKTGAIVWHNLLKKMGTGFVSIGTEGGSPRTTTAAASAAAAIAAATASRTAAA